MYYLKIRKKNKKIHKERKKGILCAFVNDKLQIIYLFTFVFIWIVVEYKMYELNKCRSEHLTNDFFHDFSLGFIVSSLSIISVDRRRIKRKNDASIAQPSTQLLRIGIVLNEESFPWRH